MIRSSSLFCIFIFALTSPAQEPQGFDRLLFHAAPKPLSAEAKTSDWPRMLGPTDDGKSPETHLLHDWGPAGPKKVWEVTKGDGYTSPSIVGDYCVIFHALDNKETVECLHRETGKRFWNFGYEIQYQDRLGYANGPRCRPVIREDCVVSLGEKNMPPCLDLKTGAGRDSFDSRRQGLRERGWEGRED